MKNISVNAGFAVGRLRQKLVGFQVMAIVGYTAIPDDEEGFGRVVAHWRTGVIKELRPDDLCPEIVIQFEWSDDEGTAEIGVFEDEDIILIFTPKNLNHLKALN